jgi:hypothetical protein
MKMVAMHSSETSVHTLTMRRYVAEDGSVQELFILYSSGGKPAPNPERNGAILWR